MTRRRHQGSLVFPLFLVFLGLMFLLINLGIVDRSIWSDVIRFWPVLLILMGIDTLLRRSSAGAAFGTVLSTVVLIAAGITLFHLFAPASWTSETQSFSHSLDGASAAEVMLSCRDCSMELYAAPASDTLISGHLTLRRDEKLTESVRISNETIRYQLESEYWLPFPLLAERGILLWEAGLNDSIPLTLSFQTGGAVDLDLTNLEVSSVDISTGEERCQITLSQASSATLFLSGDRIEVLVPGDVAVRVTGSASMELSVPSDYVRTKSAIHSPNYETASIRAELVLRSGVEWIEIKSIK
jgi:cell wall-active antibiotic response 4TMS protein YvqF